MSFLADLLQIVGYIEQHSICAALVVVLIGVMIYIIRSKEREIRSKNDMIAFLQRSGNEDILYEYCFKSYKSDNHDFILQTMEEINEFIQNKKNRDSL